jgi:ABC-type oligopeptide transport system substrate-binding subunit
MHRLLLALALLLPGLGAGAQDAPKTLRYAFRVAETGFDPAKIQDLYSRVVTPHIFEALVGYDHLARPAKLKPLTTTELPVPSEDFKVWTARVRPAFTSRTTRPSRARNASSPRPTSPTPGSASPTRRTPARPGARWRAGRSSD